MKNTLKATVLIAIVALVSVPKATNAQAMDEGNVGISIYYGFPNFYTAFLRSTYAAAGLDEEIGGIGPLGFRGEYMATDRIGIGAEFNYTNTTISWREDPNGFGTIYSYDVSAPRIRAMMRLNFHFGTSDVFDFYAGVGAGYSNVKFKFDSNEPGWEPSEVPNPIPVAFRGCVGTTYFFTDFLGASAEIGIGGGALLHFGLTAKL
jgi:opacity protein-like surface antigen